jgi:hypothetical protein
MAFGECLHGCEIVRIPLKVFNIGEFVLHCHIALYSQCSQFRLYL